LCKPQDRSDPVALYYWSDSSSVAVAYDSITLRYTIVDHL